VTKPAPANTVPAIASPSCSPETRTRRIAATIAALADQLP
jgi:hypothetical protein